MLTMRAFKTASLITASMLVCACAESPQLVRPTRVTVADLNDESLMKELMGEVIVTTGKIDCSKGPRQCVVSAPDSPQTTAALGMATDAGGSISDCDGDIVNITGAPSINEPTLLVAFIAQKMRDGKVWHHKDAYCVVHGDPDPTLAIAVREKG